MNTKRVAAVILAMTALAASAIAQAQPRPGIDRPIRVGMFKGTGTGGRYWHTNTHTSHTILAEILANPGNANLGDSLVIPIAGFTFYSMPVALDSTGMECTGSGCGPTAAQITAFVAAMDTLDVIVMSSVSEWGSRVSNAAHRQAFSNFWTYKGYVAIHMTDQFGSWAPLDTIHGARMRGHPPEQTGTIRRDLMFEGELSWRFLNRGVFSNGSDTSLFEEWFYFTISGSAIRSNEYLRPTTILDESSIANTGTQAPMGDHPISWYKQLPTGGRIFCTNLGHRADVWENARMFRRQVYNAILWTAKYDSLAQTVGIRDKEVPGGSFGDHARMRLSGGALTVSLLRDGAHTVEILALDGRRVDTRRGSGRVEYALDGLRRGAVYVVAVTTAAGRFTEKVVVP